MLRRLRSLWVVLFLFLNSARPVAAQTPSPVWRTLAPGIEYREFFLPDPQRLYVARMDRQNLSVSLETSIAEGRLSGSLETVRGMAERYDQAINYWGEAWGARNQVVVAINGSFYDPNTGVPWSGMVHSGWYAKRFFERQSGSGFAWTLDRIAFIGGCVVHRSPKQKITFLATKKVVEFDGINRLRGDDELILYTPQFDATTQTDDKGLEALVELERPLLIMPSPQMVTGVVRQVRDRQGATPIPFDHIVISASGEKRRQLLGSLQVGQEIGVSQEITHFQPDCQTPSPYSWLKTYASLGGSYVFLKEGVVQGITDLGGVLRNPRTAIAYNDRYVFFIVVDGRQRFNSLGMSMVELAVFAKTLLGATWGIAQDGGGSSTMVVNGVVKNYPNAELGDGTGEQASPAFAGENPGQKIERYVANGIMMVVVQPKEQSKKFMPGDRVVVTAASEVNLRLGPGTNFGVLGIVTPNTVGVILEHAGKMNGVLAKGAYWWKVDFGDLVGWVSEEFIGLSQ